MEVGSYDLIYVPPPHQTIYSSLYTGKLVLVSVQTAVDSTPKSAPVPNTNCYTLAGV